MNKALLHTEIQDFIKENREEDLSRLILKGSPFPEVSVQELAVQISGLRKAEDKLPSWYAAQGILYPPNLNLEQTSSEVTAAYKASLTKGGKMIDLTGGFGVDSFFFSRKFGELIHCELNKELSDIAEHNFRILGAKNIRSIKGNGIDYLQETQEFFDWIYLDPSRRDDAGGKVFMLEQCTPDVAAHRDLLLSKAEQVVIKTSPLLDLKSGMRSLGKVSEIHIVAVNNEVKELLWILNKDSGENPLIKTLNFGSGNRQFFQGSFDESGIAVPLCQPKEYLYEPNAAAMKSGLFNLLARETGTCKLHPNSHLYTSEELRDFPGRIFRILRRSPYNKKLLKKDPDLEKANVTTRNFPDSVQQIRKKLKIKEGGNRYIFFTTSLEEEKLVLICEKL